MIFLEYILEQNFVMLLFDLLIILYVNLYMALPASLLFLPFYMQQNINFVLFPFRDPGSFGINNFPTAFLLVAVW